MPARTLVLVATWEDVRRFALSLPEATERPGETLQWRIRDKTFAWERPLRPADRAHLGPDAPDGEILGVRVPDLDAKETVLADDPAVFFTTPHFDGYPAVLVRLEAIEPAELEDLLVEAWLARAPKRLAKEYLSASQ